MTFSWDRRLTFGQAFSKTFEIVFGHLDVFTGIYACQLIPVAALVLGSSLSLPPDFHPNNLLVFSQNTTDGDDSGEDDDNQNTPLWLIILIIICELAYAVVYLVCTGAAAYAAGHVVMASSADVMPTATDASSSAPTASLPPSFATSMRRGWQRTCPLLCAIICPAILVLLFLIITGNLLDLILSIDKIAMPIRAACCVVLGSLEAIGILWVVAGCACLRPAVVLGRLSLCQAFRKSFALASGGNQWFILCLHLCVTAVDMAVFITILTILGDFSLMAFAGAEQVLAPVSFLGFTAGIMFYLITPALGTVLDTVLYINLQASQGSYTPDDLAQELNMDRPDAVEEDENPGDAGDAAADTARQDELEAPLLENSHTPSSAEGNATGETEDEAQPEMV